MHRRLVRRHFAPILAMLIASVTSAATLAQGAYDDDGPDTGTRPAHIHRGRCPVPGEIVGPLSDVAPSVGVTVGAPTAFEVEHSRSTFDLTLSALVATEHVVAVHVAHDQMETIIACGDIGGPMRSATELVIGLGPVGGSGYAGIAVLTDVGEGRTMAEVYITMAAPQPSPEASPGADPAASARPYTPY